MPHFYNHWKSVPNFRSFRFHACRRFLALCLFASAASVSAQPPRHGIVSLAPNLTELAYALGFGTQLVARSSACDFPPEATALPVAGDFGRPNLEVIERLRPALVILSDVENPAILQAMRQSGVRCLKCPCEGWTNLLAAADQIAGALGDSGRADAWKNLMTARRENIRARADQFWRGRPRPRVYVEIWRDPVTTAGADSFLDDLITVSGGINIAHELHPAYPHVAPEWIVHEDPAAIVLLYMLEKGRDAAADLKSRTGWDTISAVKTGAICANIPPDLLLRSGPRCLEGTEKLANFLATKFPAPPPK